MRVSVNGKPVEGLSPKLERRLTVRAADKPVIEGVVMTTDQAVGQVARGLKLLYGSACGVAAVIMIALIIGTASWEPGDLVLLIPVALVLAGALAALLIHVYRRNLAKTRRRAEATLPRMAPAGTPIRLDGAGLSVGAVAIPWPEVTIEAVEITGTSMNDEAISYIEWLALSGGGREVTLDCLLITSGRLVVDRAWLALRPR
jgi:hypothetical protein